MAPCFSKLPSLCLEGIFKHLRMEDLLRAVGLVCTSWNKSRRTELTRRRRLVMVEDEPQLETFICDFGFESYEANLIGHVRRDDGSPWLTLESLDRIKFESLVVAGGDRIISRTSSLMFMSNITDFSFVSGDAANSTITQVIGLIAHFSEQLVFLKLSFKFNKLDYETNELKELDHNMTNLFVCFKRMLSLRHFRFYLYQAHRAFFEFIGPDMSFLSRLNTASIFFDYSNVWILPSVCEYALNVESIDLHTKVQLEELLKVDPKLDTKFTVLSVLGAYPGAMNKMKMFCTRFSSLTKLKISYIVMPMTALAQCLAQLPQLVHFYLFYPILVPEEADEEEEGHGERAQRQFHQVPSVCMFTLLFHTDSHRDPDQFFFAEIFPNLQALRLKQYFAHCEYFKIGVSVDTEASQSELAECARHTRQPLRRCANLHTVELSCYYNEYHIETVTDINQL